VSFGKDITIESLKNESYRAFFIAVGLHVSRGFCHWSICVFVIVSYFVLRIYDRKIEGFRSATS
ncbi:MAG: hypothetical protein KKC23_08530, partial [Proteobacteria bacterium]|nr:hypothetical protein [Pseudomonadota bacterium]